MDPTASTGPKVSASNRYCPTLSSQVHILPTNFPTRVYAGEDELMNLDDSILSSSANCLSPVDIPHARNLGSGVGDQIKDICVRLLIVFSTREKYTKFLGFNGDVAQDLLDLLQKLLDHAPLEPQFRTIMTASLVRLSRKSELYPRCFSIEGVIEKEEYPHAAGSFGDVYKAHHNGQAICLKICRLYQYSDQSLLYKTFNREAVIWGQLFHPNVLPFYGIHRLGDFRKSLCLVTPWICNGNIFDFLSERSNTNRIPLICDVAEGMEYLHTNGVVHGDLKCTNVLVTDSERACLTDFGLSYIADDTILTGHALSSDYDPSRASFEAPELLNLDDEYSKKTQASDVYAFGMVCFEILTGKRPFGDSGPMLIYRKTLGGEHPERPSDVMNLKHGFNDDNLWKLMESCWSHDPKKRPSAIVIKKHPSLSHVGERPTDKWMRFQRPGFDTSSGHADETIAKALSHLQAL